MSRAAPPLCPLLLGTLTLAACRSCGPPTPLPAEPTCTADAGSPLPAWRAYKLASTGLQLVLGEGYRLTPANLATDVDVIALHQDFYGVPWAAFEAGAEPPSAWVDVMDRLAGESQALGKEVFLSLALVGGKNRQTLADETVVKDGKVSTRADWTSHCYDFDREEDGQAKALAYQRYATWMVERFRPKYVNTAIEVNQFQACRDAWPGLVRVLNETYEAVKKAHPEAIVFPSFQLEYLEGYNAEFALAFCPGSTREQCVDAAYDGVAALQSDRFAISTYPYMVEALNRVEKIPADYFTRGAARAEKRLLFAETGWNARSTAAQWGASCVWALQSCDAEQRAYLRRVLQEAEATNADLVTWFSNRDVLPESLTTSCPCHSEADWCSVVTAWRTLGPTEDQKFLMELLLKVWGTMGVRDYDGKPRGSSWQLWSEALGLPRDAGAN